MLASLIAGLASGEAIQALRRLKRAVVAYLCAAIAAACGSGFLVGAVYIWASEKYGSLEAALGLGLFFMLVALLIVLTHAIAARSRARGIARKRSTDLKAMGAAMAVAAVPGLVRGKPSIGLLVAPAVALAAYVLYRRGQASNSDLPPD
jgi:ABC-type uncharacterized transport system permease subunit